MARRIWPTARSTACPSLPPRTWISRPPIIPDLRRDYGEARYWAVGPIGGRLHVLAFTMRGQVLRAISLRKANERERRRYERS
jgi:uncharacterized DUF497 family protein